MNHRPQPLMAEGGMTEANILQQNGETFNDREGGGRGSRDKDIGVNRRGGLGQDITYELMQDSLTCLIPLCRPSHVVLLLFWLIGRVF